MTSIVKQANLLHDDIRIHVSTTVGSSRQSVDKYLQNNLFPSNPLPKAVHWSTEKPPPALKYNIFENMAKIRAHYVQSTSVKSSSPPKPKARGKVTTTRPEDFASLCKKRADARMRLEKEVEEKKEAEAEEERSRRWYFDPR